MSAEEAVKTKPRSRKLTAAARKARAKSKGVARATRYREKLKASGKVRVELLVPDEYYAELFKLMAESVRLNDEISLADNILCLKEKMQAVAVADTDTDTDTDVNADAVIKVNENASSD